MSYRAASPVPSAPSVASVPGAPESGIFPRLDAAAATARLADDDERALVDALVAGDARAWRRFQDRYERLLVRCIAKVTRRFARVVSVEDEREILGTLYVSLLSNDKAKLRSFDPARGSRLSSFMGLLAVHAAYDFLRARRRDPAREGLTEALEIPCQAADPFERAAQAERASLATELLADLTEKDRTFAALYFGEELDPTEIAARLGISVKTVYSKKHKMIARLGGALEQARAA